MGLIVLIVVLLFAGLWSYPLFTRKWRRSPLWYAMNAVLLLLGTGITYLIGALAGGLDTEEACHGAGQTYDSAYRSAHFAEFGQWYPLHERCNAGYDLVPAWVNPTLAVLPLLAVLCLAFSGRLAVIHRRAAEGARPKPGTPSLRRESP
ncbi:hypothetical protein [Streptomyces sp. NBC_01304]|uniref:hypothetical protein n=1 Tax=Streptomyces sp. NBC_01304 TaxID=2903818 RepID=UPI002E1393A8|nr:hypothetical protein OG430_01225 [Streptomyces sp. NBC_01304]